jgi:SAM-dependent methyltransferase
VSGAGSGRSERGDGGPDKFDTYADVYSDLHARSVRASGETIEYFHAHKADWLVRRLGPTYSGAVLDFGCGVGNVTRELATRFACVHGYDSSAKSLERAREQVPNVRFFDEIVAVPDASYGAVLVSGVLHHVERGARPGVLAEIKAKLAPGGLLAIFEHNPANLITRRAVASCPFDDDARLLWPWEAKRLCRDAGLSRTGVEFVLFFPSAFAGLRPLEPLLHWLPLGAQYVATACR